MPEDKCGICSGKHGKVVGVFQHKSHPQFKVPLCQMCADAHPFHNGTPMKEVK